MRKFGVSFVAVVALVLSLTGVALADHYVYKAEDPAKQTSAPGIENWVFRWWVLSTTSLWWWADSSLHSDVNTIKNNWTAAVPELTWFEVTSETSADVTFKSGTCPGGAPACNSTTSYFYDSDRDASYWQKSTIYIDNNHDWTAAGKRGALAHEVGHLYGLHEQYLDSSGGGCNNSDTTIMDGGTLDGSGKIIHCDGLEGPAAIDDKRVTAYWSQGEMSNFTASASGGIGTYTWTDDAWADYRHQPKWFYYDGSQWIEYHSVNRTGDVGVHRITEKGRSQKWLIGTATALQLAGT